MISMNLPAASNGNSLVKKTKAKGYSYKIKD